MPSRIKPVFLLLFLLLPSSAIANADKIKTLKDYAPSVEPWFSGLSLNIDQDFFLPLPELNQDRNYTMGVSVEGMGAGMQFTPTGILLNEMNNLLLPEAMKGNGNYAEFHSFRIANSAYTPDRIEDPNPIYNDRPYSSLLTFSNYHLYVKPDNSSYITTELTVGILGLEYSGNLQRLFHENYRQKAGGDKPYDPQGWQYQIADGGELTGQYAISYNETIISSHSGYYDLTLNADGSVGYFTNAAVGALFRVGKINSHPLQLATDPIGYKHKGQIPVKEGVDAEFYLWGDYNLRAVGYNVLLQGQFRKSDVIFNGGKLNRLIHEVQLGLTGRLPCAVSLTYVVSGHTPEFKGSEARNHYWAGIYLTVPTFAVENLFNTVMSVFR